MIRFESMERTDIPSVLPMLHDAGWMFESRDIERLRSLPGGGVVAKDGIETVGALTVTLHLPIAWIGNVVVRKDRRGRGVAESMVRFAIDRFAKEATVFRLCSVEKARSLYDRLGFVEDGRVETLSGRGTPQGSGDGVRPVGNDLRPTIAWDRRVFGADRRALLARLASEFPESFLVHESSGAIDGYVVARTSTTGADVGPLLANAPDVAETLFDAALAHAHGGSVEVSLPLANPYARALALSRKLSFAFPTILMRRGSHEPDLPRIYALGGLEKG